MSRRTRYFVAFAVAVVGSVIGLIVGSGQVVACLGPLGVTAVRCAAQTGLLPTQGAGTTPMVIAVAIAVLIAIGRRPPAWALLTGLAGGVAGGVVHLSTRTRTIEGPDFDGSWLQFELPVQPLEILAAIVAGVLVGVVAATIASELRGRLRHIGPPLATGVVALALVGCSLAGGTLGGREKCWPEGDARAASIWRGILRIGPSGGRLETPEGDVIPLLPGSLVIHPSAAGGELMRGSDVVARAGDDVTLFGGAGADGALVVCGVEGVHASS